MSATTSRAAVWRSLKFPVRVKKIIGGFLLSLIYFILPEHPFFMAVQFHPEFLSRPLRPSPPFVGFVLAACGRLGAFLEDPEHKWLRSA